MFRTQTFTNHNNLWRGGGVKSLHLANSSPEVWPLPGPACGSTCRSDKGEARGSQRVLGFRTQAEIGIDRRPSA